jgi:hypothetical protein
MTWMYVFFFLSKSSDNYKEKIIHLTLQSLAGKYRGLQGNPCNENRDPVMRTGVPFNENRFFPVRIDLQGLGLQCSYTFYV